MIAVIGTGGPEGHVATVTSDGEGQTIDYGAPVAMQRASMTVQTTSGQLVAANAGRQGVWFQNQGANPVYLRLEAAAAVNTDWLLAAGAELRLDRLAYDVEIRAIAVGGTSVVLVLQWVKP